MLLQTGKATIRLPCRSHGEGVPSVGNLSTIPSREQKDFHSSFLHRRCVCRPHERPRKTTSPRHADSSRCCHYCHMYMWWRIHSRPMLDAGDALSQCTQHGLLFTIILVWWMRSAAVMRSDSTISEDITAQLAPMHSSQHALAWHSCSLYAGAHFGLPPIEIQSLKTCETCIGPFPSLPLSSRTCEA